MDDTTRPPSQGESKPAGRPRAPTITIDTAVNPSETAQGSQVGGLPHSPISPTDDGATLGGSSSPSRHSPSNPTQGSFKPELSGSSSFDSAESRPTSPHNVTHPLASRAADRPGAPVFLSVPSNLRSRQNSVDSEDAAVSSQGDTIVASSFPTDYSLSKKSQASEITNDMIMNDKDALTPDKGHEADFVVENNPFAFTPGQMNKMLSPKSLSAFYKLGGLAGIEKGLHSDRKTGLSSDETRVPGRITFDEAVRWAEADADRTPLGDSKEGGDAASAISVPYGANSGDPFVDRIRVFKDNRLPEKKGKSLLELMWITYNDKVLMLLSIAAVISLAVGLYQTFSPTRDPLEPKVEWVEGVAIIAAIVIVVVVGSLNDYSKELQFARLNKKKQDRVIKAIRSGKVQEVSVFDILAGDVLHLEPGDLIPVDGILIEGYNVKCDESQATGESDILKKVPADQVYAAIRNNGNTRKLDPFIQSGARVMEGVGTYMCTSTGVHSTHGRTLMSLNEDPEITPLQSKLNVIATYIAKIGGAAGLLLFIVLFIKFLAHLPGSHETPAEKGQNFLEIFIVVVTIIVVAVPEGLPLAVTLALAFATRRMLRDNNLVRHLKACEVMGNATTICSDKTGTLTQNKMQVVAGTLGTSHRFGSSAPAAMLKDSESPVEVDPSGDVSPTEFASSLSSEVKRLLVESIALNSTAFEGEVDGEMTFIGSKTETALLLFAKHQLAMGPVSEERANSNTLQLIPFDSGRKCMGIVVALPNGKARLFVKGASEIVLGQCTQMLEDPSRGTTLVPMTSEHIQTINELINRYASRSLRTIGLAYRDFEQWPPRGLRQVDDSNEVAFEDMFNNMVFTSMVGIQDPLREGVPEAVRQCQQAGVVVRMVTGDNKLTAEAIARECGILQPNSIVMEGPEFRNLSKYEQSQIIPRLHVLARSSPEDKRILVKRLKERVEIVAVTGDGTNDAPALRTADVGFSMGIAGTEVAKEASSIILMDDNFNSIVKALMWGRAVNDAVKRFLQFQLTVNVTAVILTFITSVVSSEEKSVLTAVQLLWVNLIMDTLAALALATDPPHPSVLDRKPEHRNASIISVTMWKMILGQAVYQLVITLVLYFGREKVLPETGRWDLSDERIDTLVFNTFVWMQIFNQWNNRRLDNGFNIFAGITKNPIFLAISLCMCGFQVLIIFIGDVAFKIASPPDDSTKDPLGPTLWAVAVVLGFISIPFGMVIRLIPDSLLLKLVPDYLTRRRDVPGLAVMDEEAFASYPAIFGEVRDELTFLKRFKGGRLNNLRFAMTHPRELMSRSRSPSHSRTNSSAHAPQTPNREDSFGSATAGSRPGPAPTPSPDGRRRSKSMRSRSNSALGAPTVMAGIVAAGVAAGWSPMEREALREEQGDAAADSTVPARTPSQTTARERK
ncbi:probable calcium P-type ATPase [Cephalotrichum gorgonifer]|uniref:Calcium-transporting ATPase n=1 Tax=Cephalotrichum gorgonifer TaxID=2041049 RepID=A0AAE8SXR0_9PEZI|nr:probable calcium P-type ATPase [Cephalotrichum gorgonifer]